MFLRILQSAHRQRRTSQPLALALRKFSTGRISNQAKDTRTVSERYNEACEQNAQMEKEWLARREASPEAGLDQHCGPFTWPSESHLGPFDTRVWPEAQREVDGHSKYAWVACNYGSKICLQAGWLYFSLDETKPESGIYLVSVAWRLPRKLLEKKAETNRDTSQDSTFPYGPRRVLFRGETLAEAIRLADAMLEKNFKSPVLLRSLERKAGWRDDPATIRQFYFLRRLGASDRVLKDTLDRLSKGMTYSFITDAVMKLEKSPKMRESTNAGGQDQATGTGGD